MLWPPDYVIFGGEMDEYVNFMSAPIMSEPLVLGGLPQPDVPRNSLETSKMPKVRKSFPETWLWIDISPELERFVYIAFN